MAADAAEGTPSAPAWQTRLAATFRALRNYNYRLYWCGQLGAMTGSWIQRTATAWLVLQISDSPLAVGAVTMLQFLPVLVFGLFGGLLADRLPKRRLLVGIQLVQAAQAVTLALLVDTGHVQLWHVYLLAIIQGFAFAVETPTRGAFVMELVGADDLPNAVALNSTNFNLSRVLGPSTAGFLIATVGTGICFWVNALSYVPAMAALLLMRPAQFHSVPGPARGAVGRQLLEGLAYAGRTPTVFGPLLLIGTVGAFGFSFGTTLPLIARYLFETGPEGYGLLSSCLGVGAMAAALIIAGRQRATLRMLLGSAVAFLLVHVAVLLCPWFVVTAVLLGALGGTSIVVSATAQTLIQLAAPGQMRGRVMGLFSLTFMGLTPLGALAIGALSEALGVRNGLMVVVGICALGTLATWLYLRRSLGPGVLADA